MIYIDEIIISNNIVLCKKVSYYRVHFKHRNEKQIFLSTIKVMQKNLCDVAINIEEVRYL